MEIVTSWMEQGIQRGLKKGLQQGRQEGEQALVVRLLQRRFGPISARTQNRIRKLSIEKLESLAESLLDFRASADLKRWLDANEAEPKTSRTTRKTEQTKSKKRS